MSVRDTQARLATPGDEVIVPADAGQLACLAAIDDADYIIQDEVVLKSGVPCRTTSSRTATRLKNLLPSFTAVAPMLCSLGK